MAASILTHHHRAEHYGIPSSTQPILTAVGMVLCLAIGFAVALALANI